MLSKSPSGRSRSREPGASRESLVLERNMSESHVKHRRTAILEGLVDAIENPILLVDRSGSIVEGNATAKRMFANHWPGVTDKAVRKRCSGKQSFVDQAMIEETWTSGRQARSEIVRRGHFFEVKLQPMFDDEGAVEGIVLYAHDITERRDMEAALRQAEKKYRKIFEDAMEGIFQATLDGRVMNANRSFAAMHGFDSPEALISSVLDISKLHADEEMRRELARTLDEKGRVENFEIRTFRRDGSVGWISASIRVVKDEDGKPLHHEGTMQDITTRKAAEEALRESEERYRTAVEASNDGIAVVKEGKHVFVNRRFAEMFGYSNPEEILGLPVTFNVHSDDRDRVMRVAERRRGDHAPVCLEFRGLTRTGGTIDIEASAINMTYEGKLVSFVYLRDITQRKAAEGALIESHRELERLNRAKSKAVNHISHELKTPLAVVSANARLLRRRLERASGETDAAKFLDPLQRNVRRLCEISDETDEILRASNDMEPGGLVSDLDRAAERMENLAPVPDEMRVHMEAIREWASGRMSGNQGTTELIEALPFIRSVVRKVRRHAKRRGASIIVEKGEKLSIRANPSIAAECLLTLLKNAVENTPDGGRVSVRVEERAGKTWIDVVDTGVGIAEEDRPYIFDGFFHATETDLYSSRRPYDFGAGGKGLELLKVRVYSKRFGFAVDMVSERCAYVSVDGNQCPGNVAFCAGVTTAGGCGQSCGSTFSLGFPHLVA